jgi:crotonobetainyl-CoA:carnitine CoA-transferase CaiB-like acyl-CoA transferase
MLPLEGTTVVSIDQAVSAPLAARHLADLGARVIKVERPDGGDFARRYDRTVGGLSSHFVWLNRGKQSVALDLKTPSGRDVMTRLLEHADVFLHNLAPGAVDRLGLDAVSLRARHPRLVICAISGYGTSGPLRQRRAYDLLVQSEAALVSITGSPDQPAKAGIPVADIAAGMYAYSSTLAALLSRARTGEGVAFEVTLFDSLVEWMGHPLHVAAGAGQNLHRSGLAHPTIAPYDRFETADGAAIVLGVQNDREWSRLARDVLCAPELADDPDYATNVARVRNRERVQSLVGAAIGELPLSDALAALDGAGIAYALLNAVSDLLEHPQLAARDRWRTVETPGGSVRVPRSAVEPLGEAPMNRVPDLGADTDAVLRSVGYGTDEISALRTDGVIA